MTIEEAIRILSAYAYENKTIPVQELDDAIKLGIEALKREKGQRTMGLPSPIVLLPGETRE